MNQTTIEYVVDFIRQNQPNRILEIGSGESTPVLQQLAAAYGGHLTSVEDDWRWYQRTADRMKGHSNVTLLFDSDIWPFVNSLEGTFTLVIIDGPGSLYFNRNAEWLKVLSELYDMKLKRGFESWFCLYRIWNNIDKSSTVIVDGRSPAVIYYRKALGCSISIEGVGSPNLSTDKSFYIGDDEISLYRCTIIRKRSN